VVSDERRDTLARTAKAIHTLFYADERAGERYKALEATIETDAELAAFQDLSVGLIDFDPIPEEELRRIGERMNAKLAEYEAARPKGMSDRVIIDSHDSPEGRYIVRLLEKMYTNWQGTLDFERGRHRFVFFSPFDEELRRHSGIADVAVDGESADVWARSYVLGPYLCVRDERTKRESDDPWRVLGGDLTPILPEEEAAA
jgi:hypothetical protein